jgi:hypothetical protein
LSLCLGACEGSGCGEAPDEKQSKPGVGAAGGKSSGGGDVSLGQNTQNAINAPLKDDTPAPKSPRIRTSSPVGAVFADVDKAGYEAKVVKALGAVLVVSHTPGCRHWAQVRAALQGLAADFAGKVAVYLLDVSDPAQAEVLPSGMTALPVPSFAYYEDGQALAQRQGLPFEPRVGKHGEPRLEGPEAYQQRLRSWLREAVASKNFNLPAPR